MQQTCFTTMAAIFPELPMQRAASLLASLARLDIQ
jgi:hypothetical protein